MALTGNAATIASFFSNKGLSSAGTAAILGTWQAESGLQPGITNSIGAHGLAQWLGSRRTALQSLAARLGSNENNLDVQLQYAWQELNSPEYASLLHELQTTNDPEQAARDFVNIYERPGPGGDASAPGYALTFFHGGVPGGGGHPGATPTQPAGVFGPGPNSPWLQGLFMGFGTAIGGNPNLVNNAASGVQGVTQGLISIVHDFALFLNMLSDLFKPSFWLRVGAFVFGVIVLIGGFVMLKGSVL